MRETSIVICAAAIWGFCVSANQVTKTCSGEDCTHSDVPTFENVECSSDEPCRLILAYSDDPESCAYIASTRQTRTTESEPAAAESLNDSDVRWRLRQHVIRQLEQKFGEAIIQQRIRQFSPDLKPPNNEADGLSKTRNIPEGSLADPSSEPFLDLMPYFVDDDLTAINKAVIIRDGSIETAPEETLLFPRLESRYLESLQMEIVEIPPQLGSLESMRIAESLTLPGCLDAVYPDEVRRYPAVTPPFYDDDSPVPVEDQSSEGSGDSAGSGNEIDPVITTVSPVDFSEGDEMRFASEVDQVNCASDNCRSPELFLSSDQRQRYLMKDRAAASREKPTTFLRHYLLNPFGSLLSGGSGIISSLLPSRSLPWHTTNNSRTGSHPAASNLALGKSPGLNERRVKDRGQGAPDTPDMSNEKPSAAQTTAPDLEDGQTGTSDDKPQHIIMTLVNLTSGTQDFGTNGSAADLIDAGTAAVPDDQAIRRGPGLPLAERPDTLATAIIAAASAFATNLTRADFTQDENSSDSTLFSSPAVVDDATNDTMQVALSFRTTPTPASRLNSNTTSRTGSLHISHSGPTKTHTSTASPTEVRDDSEDDQPTVIVPTDFVPSEVPPTISPGLSGPGQSGPRTKTISWPNDPYFKYQWHLRDDAPYSVGAERVWHMSRVPEDSPLPPAEPITVAVIDSGCDIYHPELSSQLWRNPNEICDDGIDNDGNGYVDDCVGWDFAGQTNKPVPEGSGHGTAAAGIIAAESDNHRGIAGICWHCRIMCLKFIKGTTGRVSDQIAAIDYAIKQKARLSNNSYGGYGLAGPEYLAIRRAQKAGHLFVASAGNNNRDTDSPRWPHSPSVYPLDNILAVGASTRKGEKAAFSNYGALTVDAFAPGQSILTTSEGGAYAIVSGTSFAAPMAVGAAAVVWSHYPALSYSDIVDALIGSCIKLMNTHREVDAGLTAASIAATEGGSRCGGVLNIPAALERADRISRYRILRTPSLPLTAFAAFAAGPAPAPALPPAPSRTGPTRDFNSSMYNPSYENKITGSRELGAPQVPLYSSRDSNYLATPGVSFVKPSRFRTRFPFTLFPSSTWQTTIPPAIFTDNFRNSQPRFPFTLPVRENDVF